MKSPPAWMRQIDDHPERLTGAASGNICDAHECGNIAWGLAHTIYGKKKKEVSGITASPNSGLTAFAYLWRRFGPPWGGSDPHKNIASYTLGTPHKDVFLHIYPSGSPLPFGCGYFVTESLEHKLYAPFRVWDKKFEAWWIKTKASKEERAVIRADNGKNVKRRKPTKAMEPIFERYSKDKWDSKVMREAEKIIGKFPGFHRLIPGSEFVSAAIIAAMRELLRPMFVRDVPINIFGRVEGAVGQPAPCSIYAGYGLTEAKKILDGYVKEDKPNG